LGTPPEEREIIHAEPDAVNSRTNNL